MTHTRKIQLYKVLILVFAVFILFLSGDGVKNPEINRRSMCIVMGIDSEGEKISASVQIIVPEPQGQGKQMIVTETGETLSDALDRINISIGQKVELGHCGLIILGSEYTKKSIFPELLYLLSSGKTSPEVNLAVAKDMKAKEILSKLNDLSKVVSEGINNIVSYADSGVHVTRIGVLSFLSDSFSAGRSGAIPCVELGTDKYGGEGSSSGQDNKNGGGSSAENSSGGGGGQNSSSGQSQGQTVIKGIDTLVMLKDGAYCGILDSEGTRGKVWLNKSSVTGLVLLKDVRLPDGKIDSLSCKLIGKKIKTKVSFKDGKPVFSVKMTVKISIDDKYKIVDVVDNGKNRIYSAISDAMKKMIEQQIDEGIRQSKEADCDIFGINEKFNKFQHKKYLKYGDVLKDVETEYDISINIL